MLLQEFDIPFASSIKTHAYVKGEIKDNARYIIMLHDGPGGAASLLTPFFDLCYEGYTIISYDQLGCGLSSEIKKEDNLYNFAALIKQLKTVVEYFKLNKFNLLGHGFGGMLALEYLLRVKDNKVNKLILFSTLANAKTYNESNLEICSDLLDYKDEYYAFRVAYRNHDFNKNIRKIFEKRINAPYYNVSRKTAPHPYPRVRYNEEMHTYMWGEFDLFITGKLKDYDIVDKLNKIENETLIIHGKYDESTEKVNEELYVNIPNSKDVLLKYSGHFGYYNEYTLVNEILLDFLKNHK